MSRDIFVQDIPEGISRVEEIPDDWTPQPLPFGAAEVLGAIHELVPDAYISDPESLHISIPGVDVEVSLSNALPLKSFALHVRASDQAAADALIRRLLSRLGARAFDPEADSGIFQS